MKIQSPRGFTLIEVMIVLVIVTGVISMSMPYMTSRNSQTKAFLRELTVLSRDLHTKAKLQGVVYRLVIDMGESDAYNPQPQSFWVEKSVGKAVIKESEEEKTLAHEQDRDDRKKPDPRGFQVDTSVIKQKREPPKGLRFERIELSRSKSPLTKGKAFIHYLPEGLVDETAIQIKGDRGQNWTISIHPLTGKAELLSREVSLKEIKSQ